MRSSLSLIYFMLGVAKAFTKGQTIGTSHSKDATRDEPFIPKRAALGQKPDPNVAKFSDFLLSTQGDTVATLDDGHIVGGVPWFEVSSLSGPSQIEVKYSEQYHGLLAPFADGPYLFANQVSNNFRIETFNITDTGRTNAFLVQGGQRWQSIGLVTNETITFSKVGFYPSFANVDPEDEPGLFKSSNKKLDKIWKLGVRGAQSSCLEEMSQPATWRVHPENGVLIESLRPSQSEKAPVIGNHTLEFDTRVEQGGLWWGIGWAIGSGPGIGLQITGDLPEETTFANHNYTLSPRNSLTVTSGYGQYNIRTHLKNDYLSVSIDNKQVFNISTKPILSNVRGQVGPIDAAGRFGLGAYQDQKAYYRNLTLYDESGNTVYYSNLTSKDVLTEYGVQGNIYASCMDGPKRDRLIWLGDYYHTSRIIGASTARHDLQKGTFDSLLPTQLETGQFSMAAPLGYEPNVTVFSDVYRLEDYQLLGIMSLYYYVQSSNDINFVRENWSQFRLVVDWITGHIDEDNGLVRFDGAFLGPAEYGSAVSCLTVQALNAMGEVATAVNDFKSAEKWRTAAADLSVSVRAKLWNNESGTWKLSVSSPGNFSVASTAFCINAGVSTTEQATRTVKALDKLSLGPGYLDNTIVDPASPTASISPNINGFLLSALFEAGEVERGSKLIDSLWGSMINDDLTSSGASWEYVLHDGSPGLGLFTSLGHPWGGAATYVLTERAAGLRPADGIKGYGYQNWVIDPKYGVEMGLTHASARVLTALGGLVEVTWKLLKNRSLHVIIGAPKKR